MWSFVISSVNYIRNNYSLIRFFGFFYDALIAFWDYTVTNK